MLKSVLATPLTNRSTDSSSGHIVQLARTKLIADMKSPATRLPQPNPVPPKNTPYSSMKIADVSASVKTRLTFTGLYQPAEKMA